MANSNIVLGDQIVFSISAAPGGKAEEVLREIAHPGGYQPSNRREFAVWDSDTCVGSVKFYHTGVQRNVTLLLNGRGDLHLTDVKGTSFSPKPLPDGSLPIGDRLEGNRLAEAATQIAAWVLHGRNWVDKSGKRHEAPWGVRPPGMILRGITPSFVTVDGALENLTLSQIIELGAVRSAHPGTWHPVGTGNATAVPAATGMPVLLHEFQERGGAQDYDICRFGDVIVSEDFDIWGGACQWSNRNLGPDGASFQDLANTTASPLGFHLAATRRVFSDITTVSAYLLDHIGALELKQLLTAVVESDPERFYRLIDADGGTHRFVRATDIEMQYEDGHALRRADAAGNVVETFREMGQLEHRIDYQLPRRVRLAMDSHFYTVILAMLTQVDGHAYHLSGLEMHKYMVNGHQDAHMHAIRNPRLFDILRRAWPASLPSLPSKIVFHLYPSERIRVAGTQYAFNRQEFDADRWLGTRLV